MVNTAVLDLGPGSWVLECCAQMSFLAIYVDLLPFFCKDMVVDLKVLDSIVYDDDPEHINISFGESFFSSWRK